MKSDWGAATGCGLTLTLALALVLELVGAATANAQQKETAPQNPLPPKKINFDSHDGHFVKNTFKAPEQGAFFIMTTFDEFDRVFGTGFVMKAKFKLVTKETFNAKNVLVVVRQVPNKIIEYTVGGIEADGDKLSVNYSTTIKTVTFQANSALILSVPKGDYREVVFVENGKRVAAVPLSK